MAVVRVPSPDEWSLLRELRLRALEDAPEAFTQTLAEVARRPDEAWRARAARTAADPRVEQWVVEDETGRAAGMVLGRMPDGEAIVQVFGMWVDASARGSGLGRALLDAVVEWGRSGGALVAELWVTEGNAAALGLYEAAGFRTTGDRLPLRRDASIRIVRMRRDL